MKEYTTKELEKFLEKAKELGWNYNLYKEDNERTYVEMEKYSPLGEDFSMVIDFSEENPVETFIADLRIYYNNFDPEEHAEMWIENRGKNGTPSSIQALLDDANNIDEMIGDLIRYLEYNKEEKDMKNEENMSSDFEMNVGKLKEIIKNLPDDIPVFVACQGYCNYDFQHKQPWEDTDTFAVMHDNKLFITDDCAVETGNGTI